MPRQISTAYDLVRARANWIAVLFGFGGLGWALVAPGVIELIAGGVERYHLFKVERTKAQILEILDLGKGQLGLG